MVVITIIVVLLALLTPALEEAAYQGRLAVCSTNQKGIALGVTTYATNNQSRYPVREGVLATATDYNWHPIKIYDPNRGYDDRVPIRDYLPVNKILNDPLSNAVDLEGSKSTTSVYSSYSLWYGWQYPLSGYGELDPMFRIGDRWSWRDSVGEYRFNVIASDFDRIIEPAVEQIWGSHPDEHGATRNWSPQDQDLGGGPQTYSYWVVQFSSAYRGPIDTNYAYSDGSVSRYNDVTWDDAYRGDRMVKVAEFSNSYGPPGWWQHMPRN